MKKSSMVMVCLAVAMSSLAWAQNAEVVTPKEQKFAAIPGLPDCAKIAGVHGDPNSDKGAVVVLKATAGCVAPWHWHTANEELGIVSGNAKLAMKDGGTKTLTPASYVYMPAKHQHEFTCTTACTLFLATEGKFDIHYVDASGKEIPPDEALKHGKGAGASKSGAAKKKE